MPAFPLHDAARQGDVPGIQKLLDKETTQVNGRDKHSRTALHLAAWAGHVDAVRMLLANGANAHAAAMDDMNALHFAAQKGHAEVIQLLLIAGINANAKTRKGLNALQIAAQQGHLEATRQLLKKGANPLAANSKGQTAAQLAKTAEVREALQKAESVARERQYNKAQKKAEEKGTAQQAQAAGPEAPATTNSAPQQPPSTAAEAAGVPESATPIGPTARPPASSTETIGPPEPAAGVGVHEADPSFEVSDVAIGPALGPPQRPATAGGSDSAGVAPGVGPDEEQHVEPIGPAMPPGWGSRTGGQVAEGAEAAAEAEEGAAEPPSERRRPAGDAEERPVAKKARVVLLSHLGDAEDE